jgi:asparagine N-glycosylation enzyme membrane subunit Stt3
MRHVLRWMFGRRPACRQAGEGAAEGGGGRLYRVLFWLLLAGVAIAVLAIFFTPILYYAMAFAAGVLVGAFLEHRRRRAVHREAEAEQDAGRRRKR